MRHVGVDGCKSGWLAVTRNSAGLEYRLFSDIQELACAFSDAERILVDIPIGLPWADAPVRPCDRLARDVLGRPRKSSVFPVPCREALAPDDLDAAQRINRTHIGRSVGVQTWSMSPKIAEMDRFLLSDSVQPQSIREIHPEVCFWALAGRKPMRYRQEADEV
jgi:predicted RNase H-like nuclease